MRQALRTGLLVSCGVFAAAITATGTATGTTAEAAAQQAAESAPQQAPRQQPAPQYAPQQQAPEAGPEAGPVPLEWTPPALLALSAQASLKDSFTLDRNLLRAAAGLWPATDEPTRNAFNKLDGISVHLLRFGQGVPDEGAVNAIREAYHLRGWKHLVTTSNSGGPLHNGHTDVWMVVDGVNVRGAVILAETPRSVTLVTVAGNLSPVDIFHLRGHFGIPQFNEAPQQP